MYYVNHMRHSHTPGMIQEVAVWKEGIDSTEEVGLIFEADIEDA